MTIALAPSPSSARFGDVIAELRRLGWDWCIEGGWMDGEYGYIASAFVNVPGHRPMTAHAKTPEEALVCAFDGLAYVEGTERVWSPCEDGRRTLCFSTRDGP